MADITLSDGRQVSYDLSKITIREFRALFKTEQPDSEEWATLAKVTGLTAQEIGDLSYPDYRRLAKGFFEAAKDPLADPN